MRFLFTFLPFLAVVMPVAAQTSIPNTYRGSITAVARGVLNGNLIETNFRNFGELARWQDRPAGVWPKSIGDRHADGIGFAVTGLVLAERAKWSHLVPEWSGLADTLINPVSMTYRDAGTTRGPDGAYWGWLPLALDGRPGFHNPSRRDGVGNPSPSPARSDDPMSWPESWPDRLEESDAGWPGAWNGLGGKNVFLAGLETFYVMSDDSDAQYHLDPATGIPRSPYGVYYPDPADSTLGGLGLVVEVRTLQYSQALAEDVMFLLYRVTNRGKTDHGNQVAPGDNRESGLWFTHFIDFGMGLEEGDEAARFEPQDQIAYGWDIDGIGTREAGSNYTLGYMGLAYLQTPGNPADGLDNDGDGMRDEDLYSGAGALIEGQDAIRSYVESHYDLARFEEKYGPLDSRPAFREGRWWTGDEDLGWTPLGDVGRDGVNAIPSANFPPDAGERDRTPTEGEPDFGEHDPSEADAFGLTGFDLNPRAFYDQDFRLRDDTWFWSRIVASTAATGAQLPAQLVESIEPMMVASVGPVHLPPQTSEWMAVAWVFGADEEDFLANLRVAARIHAAGYRLNSPPPAPTLQAVRTGEGVQLTWDDVSTIAFDPYTRSWDFEGFILYRSISGSGLTPIAQWDLENGITGSVQIAGTPFELGNDSGFDAITRLDGSGEPAGFTYVDQDLVAEGEYIYSIVAYDHAEVGVEGGVSPQRTGYGVIRHWDGAVYFDGPNATMLSVQTGTANSEEQPLAFALNQNYPNPFNPSTTFSFDLPVEGEVELTIHDMLGRRVATVARGRYLPGTHDVRWNGALLPSGVYVYRLRFGSKVLEQMLVLAK